MQATTSLPWAFKGVHIDRSTLCHWVGFAAAEVEPLYVRLTTLLKQSAKHFCDETRCPVLDPGLGKTKTGYLWTVAGPHLTCPKTYFNTTVVV